METFLEKISSYHIFNYLVPGILFALLIKQITPYTFIQADLFIAIFLYYFIGLTISRFGSLVVEPLLKRLKFLKVSEYKDYILASRKDSFIEVFSEMNNMYRTLTSMAILLFLLKVYFWVETQLPILHGYNFYILIGCLLIIFIWSYKKQTNYITKRISSAVN